MRTVKPGFVISIPVENAVQPTSFIKQVSLTGTEVIGRVFKILGNKLYLTLSDKDTSDKVLNIRKHKMFNITDNIRLVTDEEIEYWRQNDNLYSFTMNILYKSRFNFVFENVLLRAVMLKLSLMAIEIQDNTSIDDIAKSIEIRAILDIVTIIKGKVLKMEESRLNELKTLKNRQSIVITLPIELTSYPNLFPQVIDELDKIWKIATHLQRMWLYSSECCKLRLKV